MSDELRAAAESIVGCITKVGSGSYCRNPEKTLGLMGPYELAVHYLATAPADSEEAVTEEWLKSIGFTLARRGYWYIGRGQLRYQNTSWYLAQANGDGTDTEIYLPNQTTRRAVRDLCRSLGIDLKEPRA